MAADELNLTSLNLVRDELVATIEQSANQLEQFAADPESLDLLQGCIDGIHQISGTLSVIQLSGANMLANELLALAEKIKDQGLGEKEACLSVLTNAFFILPRYLEYAQQTRKTLPVLLIPYINELRIERGDEALSESHFFTCNTDGQRGKVGNPSAILGEDFQALVRRLRHMYQVGLVSVLKGKQVKPSLGMMQRSVERLDAVTGNRSLGRLWWVAAAALGEMALQGMELTRERKLLLGALDRQIKTVQKGGQSTLDSAPDDAMLKELVYLLSLSGKPAQEAQGVISAFGVQSPGYTDADLSKEREALKGPSVTTVSSVAAVMTDELRSIKDILERASQGGTEAITDYEELLDTLNKVAEILAVVGLTNPSATLKEEITKIENWRDTGQGGDGKELLDIADTLLYIESTVAGLARLNLSDEKLSEANKLARKEVIANNQLAEAEMVVIQEAESGLALVKRALSSFAESNFDRGHIKNVASTLNTVRGGMVLLNLERATAVVNSAVTFIEETLLQSEQPAALQQLLETFADAVISLEYYLDAIRADKHADDSVLEVAEESLSALGHPARL